MCNLIKRRKYASQSQHTYTATSKPIHKQPQNSRYTWWYTTVDVRDFQDDILLYEKRTSGQKNVFHCLQKYYHLSSRHVNKKVNNPEVISTHKTRLFAHFFKTLALN